MRLVDPNGPNWASSSQDGPKRGILVQHGLSNASICLMISYLDPIGCLDRIRPFCPVHLPIGLQLLLSA